MTQLIKRRTVANRIVRAVSVLRRRLRIMRRYANRWDATCAGLRLTWATLWL